MKVIVAGFSKTGTKSVQAALKELGYTTYDYVDSFWHHGDVWIRIMAKGGKTEDFKHMYENVDAVTGSPALIYWEEIHKAFPGAKIILTTREEDKFFESLKKHSKAFERNFQYKILQVLSPTGRKFFYYFQLMLLATYGIYLKHPFDSYIQNELLMKKTFRRHQLYCEKNAPQDKLLVFNVKQGWEPICKFLGKDIPNKPFPHKNVGGSLVEDMLTQHPAWARIYRESVITLASLLGFSLLGVYTLFKAKLLW